MARRLNVEEIQAALDRAAHKALHGTRDERSGRFFASSVIASVDYDEDTRELDIIFTSGKIYRYFDVPLAIYAEFLDAASKGVFFNANIKDAFRFAEVGNGER
jgi:KTSC domain